MFVSRRHFLIGTAATTLGVILPSFAERAVASFERTGGPLLEPSRDAGYLFTAVQSDYGIELFDATVPPLPPESLTWKEFLARRGETAEEYLGVDEDDLREEGFDEATQADDWTDWWALAESPNAVAFNRLRSLDLGPDLRDRNSSLGHLRFIDGFAPGFDYLGVYASCPVALSCLQERLNILSTGIRIEMSDSKPGGFA